MDLVTVKILNSLMVLSVNYVIIVVILVNQKNQTSVYLQNKILLL